ncbi:MAG: hypothetical protein HY319_19050 [Armatimonadetes bacterium]|nr:hypothetical protein [Armatimonadota bacterium]
MARLSASISESLKDQLYSAAEEQEIPVSHIVQAALDSYLNQGEAAAPRSSAGSGPELAALRQEVARLNEQIDHLRRDLLAAPRRGSTPTRFF